VSEVIRAPADLERLATEMFRAWGADDEVAATVARHLVGANLAGHDSHGVIRIAQYAEEREHGVLDPAARAQVVEERGAVAVVDGRRGFGHHATALAMRWSIERSRETGIAAAAVRHGNHIGRLGEYAEMAAAAGVVGIVTVGIAGGGGVAPFGARGRFIGTNPWAIGVPADEGEPFIFDAATSALAEGKVRVARAKAARLPEGVITDKEGRPSTDPEDYYSGGALQPLGGSLAGHKGYGLSLAAALVGGLAMIADTDPTSAGAGGLHGEAWIAGAFTIAIDPDAFGGAERYRELVAEVLKATRRRPPAAGVDAVLIAGDVERRMRDSRRQGIPIPERTWAELRALAERYGLAVG
jgi:LDH2 family malate/lactate/ureidoglycolate dehydrogenase